MQSDSVASPIGKSRFHSCFINDLPILFFILTYFARLANELCPLI